MLVKCWNVAYWNASRLLLNLSRSCYRMLYCIFHMNVNLKLYFWFLTIITNIGPEKQLELVSLKEMLAIMGEILRVLTNYSYRNICLF